MGFRISGQKPRRVMIADRDDAGRAVLLPHDYFDATPEQLVEYYRLLSKVKPDESGRNSPDGNLVEARLYLWQGCIHRVVGYELEDGTDLMTRENWKDLVPPHHRVEAAVVMEPDYNAARLPKPAEGARSPFIPPVGSGSPAPEKEPVPEPSDAPTT